MITHTPELIDYLNNRRAYTMADLYTFTLVGGTVLRYTSADVSVIHAGAVYSARGPLIKRGHTRTVLGLQVDTLDITVYPAPTGAAHSLGGRPFIAAALAGALDGAQVTLQRAFLTSWSTPPVGVIVRFVGFVSDTSGSRSALRVDVKSALELLNTKLPRNIYQASCLHTLYDTGCAVNKAARTVTGTVTGTNGTGQWLQSGLTQANGWFDQGVLTFATGVHAGLQRTVKAHASGAFSFALPLPSAPAIGDTFSVYPGCDKTQATCSGKFSNLPRFRGMPYIPVPETAT